MTAIESAVAPLLVDAPVQVRLPSLGDGGSGAMSREELAQLEFPPADAELIAMLSRTAG